MSRLVRIVGLSCAAGTLALARSVRFAHSRSTRQVTIAVMALAIFTASAARATTVDLTSGTTGTDSQPSFEGRTRGVDVTVLGATNRPLSSMTAALLNIAGAATVYAQVYQSGGTLIGSGSVQVPAGPFPRTVVV
ncbi:MAG TPA: hypothetical protein VGK93_13010, partial [Candidatus Eisenbacteria bacterium]